MPQVCVLAYNNVLSDARVLKEVDTLAEAGYNVEVIGFADSRVQGAYHKRDNGVRIHLIDAQAVIEGRQKHASQKVRKHLRFHRLLGVAIKCLSAILVAMLLLLLALAIDRYDLLIKHPLLVLPFSLLGGLALILLNQSWRKVRGKLARQVTLLSGLRAKTRQTLIEEETIGRHPAIIHCHDLMTLPAGRSAKAQTGATLIWDAHEIYEELAQSDKQQQQKARKLLQANQYDVDGFVTINDSIAAFYAEHYPHLPPAVIVKNATLPIEPVVYDGRLHTAAGLPRTQRIVLYQGGFAENRGLRELVAATQFLDPSWTLILMGWGNLENHLREIADRVAAVTPERALPVVVFVPAAPHAELAQWTAGAAVGLIPYERTGLNHLYCTPNKLWEYPNADVPILCSPLVELSKAVKGNGIGWLLPEKATPQAIAECINGLTDEELVRARQACRRYIATDNWSVYERRLVALYEMLNGVSPAPNSATDTTASTAGGSCSAEDLVDGAFSSARTASTAGGSGGPSRL